MIKSFFWSKKWFFGSWGLGIFILATLYAEVHMQVLFNNWYKEIFDLFQDSKEFLASGKSADAILKYTDSMYYWGKLAAIFVTVAVIRIYVTSLFAFFWRQAITHDYLPRWIKIKDNIEGASQRLQEDPMLYADMVESLGIQIIKAVLTLFAFIPVLWHLSKDITGVPLLSEAPNIIIRISFLALTYKIGKILNKSKRETSPNEKFISVIIMYMLFLTAFLMPELTIIPKEVLSFFSVTAILWIIVKGLRNRLRHHEADAIFCSDQRLILYTAFLYISVILYPAFCVILPDIDFRQGSLVWAALIYSGGGLALSWVVGYKLKFLQYQNQVVENAFRVELAMGEKSSANKAALIVFISLFKEIRKNYFRLFLHFGYFNIWNNFYLLAMNILPMLIIGKDVFLGTITLGVLMQVDNVFSKVNHSFSLFIHNWPTITKLQSVVLRLGEFEQHLDEHQPKQTAIT